MFDRAGLLGSKVFRYRRFLTDHAVIFPQYVQGGYILSLAHQSLCRYKEQTWFKGPSGSVKTGFPEKKAVSAVAKSLRGQMVQGPAALVLEGF